MASVASSLDRIKQDLSRFVPEQSIEAACKGVGHRWRERKLGPVRTIHLFILQVLNFNTAMTHLRHLSKAAVKASGYCKARAAAMQQACASEQALWRGLRAYLIDGSSTITPDTRDSQRAFGQPKAFYMGTHSIPRRCGCDWQGRAARPGVGYGYRKYFPGNAL